MLPSSHVFLIDGPQGGPNAAHAHAGKALSRVSLWPNPPLSAARQGLPVPQSATAEHPSSSHAAPDGPAAHAAGLPCADSAPGIRTSAVGGQSPAGAPLPAQNLAEAFADFISASSRLEGSYRELQGRVSALSSELADRNAALRSSQCENERMRLSLERIVDFMPCGVLVVDRAGTILTVNPEALRLLDAAAPGLPQGAPRPGLNNIGAWGHLDLRSFYAEGAGDSQQEFCIGTANGGSPGADGSRWLEVRSRCLDAETTAAVKGSTLGRFEAGPPQRKPRNASQNIPNNLPPQHLTRNRLPSVAGNTSRPASAPPYGSGQIEEQRAEETATPAAAATSGRQTILILRDITAAKRMEADRERALRAMTLAEITTMLAHEIRNPLTSMELFAGLLAADRVSNPEWISHLRAGIRSLSGTVNNVLSFHGACAMTLSEVDLPAVVQASIDFVRPLADQSGISLEWLREASLKAPLSAAQGPCAGPGHEHATARRPWKKSETRIMGSESALQQVVLNLLTNAIRHTPRGGAVRVSMKIVGRQKNSRQHLEDSQKQRVPAPLRGASWPVPSPVHPVAVPGRRKFGRSLHPARVLLAFEDNGRGMPAEALSRIFEPGFSAGGDTPGLGLTVCKTILDQHGARISVTSRPGSGATFALEFPLI